MSRRFKSIILCCVIVMTAICGLTMSASAATRGGASRATITVKTKSNYWYPGASSITLTQQKQTYTCASVLGSKTKSITGYYGQYDISIYNVTTGKTSSTTWSGGKTKKISLDPNCTYRITVAYSNLKTSMFTRVPIGYYGKNLSNPSWQVSSRWKVSSYS